jgi:hypothetical protein
MNDFITEEDLRGSCYHCGEQIAADDSCACFPKGGRNDA